MLKVRKNKYGQKFEDWKEPFEFFTFYPKKEETKFGIMSLQTLYDKGEYDLFDKMVEKQIVRLINDKRIFPEITSKDLTREEILNSINTVIGEYGSRMIYFFRYIPFKLMGNKMRSFLSAHNIYRIDLNEKDDMNLKDVWWGHYMSDMKNKELDENYYKTVIMKEYFKQYRDGLINNLSTIPHIGIATENGILPSNWFTKIKN